jgi:hypothetical protein
MLCAISRLEFGRSALLTAVLVPCTLVAATAGRAPQGGAGSATIKFTALADGNPVPDLKAGDLALKVDGKPREILSVQFVDLRKAETTAAPKSAIDPPFTTNAATAAGRDVYILIDEESIAPGRDVAVKEAANHLVSALGEGDRAALISMRQGGPNLGLSRDHTQVRKTIASIAGYGSTTESATDLTCRTVKAVQALQSVFDGARASIPPAVVLFSTSVAALQAGRITMIGRGSSGGESTPDLCQLRAEDFKRLGSAAENANVTFFAVEVLEASATQPLSDAAGGLENLAGATNGELLRMGGNVEAQMSRIAQAISSYYLVTFAPEASDRSGGGRRVELTSARSGVNLKAPREMSFGKAAGKPVTPRDMIRVGTPFNDLPLRAAAYASRNPGDKKVRVLALFEPLEPGTKLNAATIAMYDKAGKLTSQWNAQPADLAGPTGIAALLAEAGEYRMRVAATDTSGRSGAVDVQMSAVLTEVGPIHLGDLVLGKIGQNGPVPVLQFASEEEAVAIIELYGRPEGPLKMYVEILNPPGEPIQVPLAPAATNEPDKFLLSARLPIASLQPGDYTVRAIVGVRDVPEGQVTCTLRKVKTGS